MTIAPIMSLIAPARAADSVPAPAKGGFAALLSGQGQQGAPAMADAALPEPAVAAGRLKQGEPAPQAVPPLGLEMPAGAETPVEEVPAVALADDIAADTPTSGEAPAQPTGDPKQTQAIADAQPIAPATTTAIATVSAAPPLVAPGAEPAAAAGDLAPVKGIRGSKADRAEKTGQFASSDVKDRSRLAESLLPAMPVQDQSTATKPTVATAATTLVTPQPGMPPQGETPLAPEGLAGKSVEHAQVVTANAGTPQPGLVAARQESAGPAESLADGAPSPANSGEANLSAPVSRPVAFSDVYATRQPAASPVVAAQAGTMGREMGVEIARHVTAGRSEMIVRLDPPEMGRIDIRLSFNHDGGLRAVMSADNQSALDLLRRETGDLTRALSDAGVKADAQSFRFDSRGGDTGQRGQPQQQHQPGREAGHGLNTLADEQPRYRTLRASGRVDMMA